MTLATIALCAVLPNMYSFMHKAARGAMNVDRVGGSNQVGTQVDDVGGAGW
jgi:hypothetical protein